MRPAPFERLVAKLLMCEVRDDTQRDLTPALSPRELPKNILVILRATRLRVPPGQKIASLLSARPVRVTFEAVPVQEPPPVKSGDPISRKPARAKPSKKKPTEPPRKRGPSSRVTSTKGSIAVTTQRKAFRVQTRVNHGKAGGAGAP